MRTRGSAVQYYKKWSVIVTAKAHALISSEFVLHFPAAWLVDALIGFPDWPKVAGWEGPSAQFCFLACGRIGDGDGSLEAICKRGPGLSGWGDLSEQSDKARVN